MALSAVLRLGVAGWRVTPGLAVLARLGPEADLSRARGARGTGRAVATAVGAARVSAAATPTRAVVSKTVLRCIRAAPKVW